MHAAVLVLENLGHYTRFSSPEPAPFRSEGILQSELQDAGIARSLNLAERRGMEIAHRVVEIGVVQRVEEFETQFEPMRFVDGEGAAQSRVDVEESRSH